MGRKTTTFIGNNVHGSTMGDPHCDGRSHSDDGERLDELFEALSDRRRRCTLYVLQEEERTEVDELAGRTAAQLHGRPRDDLSEETVENVRIELYHKHLPILADSDVVEYDERSSVVVYREPPEAVETFLAYCAEREFED